MRNERVLHYRRDPLSCTRRSIDSSYSCITTIGSLIKKTVLYTGVYIVIIISVDNRYHAICTYKVYPASLFCMKTHPIILTSCNKQISILRNRKSVELSDAQTCSLIYKTTCLVFRDKNSSISTEIHSISYILDYIDICMYKWQRIIGKPVRSLLPIYTSIK